MTLAVVTVVTDGTPAAGRPGGGGGITLAGRKHQHPFDAVDDSSDGREEKVFGDVLDLEAALVEVIRGQSARRGTDADRVEQGVETQVVTVMNGGAASLEIDEYFAGSITVGHADRQVAASAQHEPVVDLDAQRSLGARVPGGLERGKAFEELQDQIVSRSPKFGSFGLGDGLKPVGQGIDALAAAGHRLVDECHRVEFSTPVNREFDRLVGNRAARDRDLPFKGFGLLEDELAFTAQHLAEGVFGDEHRVARLLALAKVEHRQHRFEAVLQGPLELVSQHGVETGPLLLGRAELGQHLLLRRVELLLCFHPQSVAHRRDSGEESGESSAAGGLSHPTGRVAIGGSDESSICCRGPFARASGSSALPCGARVPVAAGVGGCTPHAPVPWGCAHGCRPAERAPVVGGRRRHDRRCGCGQWAGGGQGRSGPSGVVACGR